MLLLYGTDDLVTPLLQLALDPLFHKLRGLWFCRVPKASARGDRYYGYAVDGPAPGGADLPHVFDPDKVLLDPFARDVYFPPEFDREAARRPGSNAGRAPLGVLQE